MSSKRSRKIYLLTFEARDKLKREVQQYKKINNNIVDAAEQILNFEQRNLGLCKEGPLNTPKAHPTNGNPQII